MLDWVIVGGGPHGVHLAVRLLGEAGVDPARLRIVDPGPRLMQAWHRCTENTGMTHLRSPGVHHLDIDPFSLIRFAADRARLRQPIDIPFAKPYNRPAVSLFAEHCDRLIEHYGLDALHVCGRATGITLDCDGARVTIDEGHHELVARRVLLALGASEQPHWPAWAEQLPPGLVRHVFEPGFTLDPATWPDRVAVVGAGITAAQAALRLADADRQVTLIARHPIRKHQFDSDPGWVGPKNMRRFLQTRDPAQRRRIIKAARHRGSLPPDVYQRLRNAMRDGQVNLVEGKICDVSVAAGSLRLTVGDHRVEVDAGLLATGFEPTRPGGALVDQLVQSHALPCATCGFPLVDMHLRWHPRLFVSGPLAELELGPVARNLIGARRAAERILPVAMEQR
jgi:cation diffusion facilitator CzcD-associated flavoprotein CzcO